MFLPRQSIVVPVGLITQPNQYGQYPSGALKTARNVVMRNPGELVQAPDSTGATTVGAANNILHRLMPLDQNHIYSFHQNGTTWSVFENANSAGLPLGVSTTNLFDATGRISPTRNHERLIVNSLQGCLVGDYMVPTSAGERALRKAGMPQPGWRAIGATPTNAGAIPNNTMVGYAVCFIRELQNGYVVRSVPSVQFKYANTSGATTNPQLNIFWNSSSSILVTDKLEVYRTDGVATAGLFGYEPDPGDTFKLVKAVPLTGGGTSIIIEDTQPFVTGTLVTAGQELYTSPFADGPTLSNRQPPIAACTETHKGFTFYGRTTDRPKWTFTFPGGVGYETNAVLYGFTAGYHKAFSVGRHALSTAQWLIASNQITGVPAADFVGLAIGQSWATASVAWPITSTITGLNSGTGVITMSTNSISASGPTPDVRFDEVLEIDGFTIRWGDLFSLVTELQGNLGNVSAQFGKWEITVDTRVAANITVFTPSVTVTIEPAYTEFAPQQFTVRGTNGDRFSPPIPLITASAQAITATTLKNHLVSSKEQEPEHAPSVFETFVGNGEILALNSTRDCCWVWCTDGLYRLSGEGSNTSFGFRVDLVNTTLILSAPQASGVLNELVYGYTNVGFVGVSSSGSLVNLTDRLIGNLLPGARYQALRGTIVSINETDNEVLLCLGENGNGNSDVVYCYNVAQQGWTSLSGNGSTLSNISAMALNRAPAAGDPRVLFGVTPLGGTAPSYSNWTDTGTYLVPTVEYQPIYGDDPLSLKQWIWADYLFAGGSATKTITPMWNGVSSGTATIADQEGTGYARAGVPRSAAISHVLTPGWTGATGAPQTRFQGLSVVFKSLTSQSKRR